jgi:hypothetical protein
MIGYAWVRNGLSSLGSGAFRWCCGAPDPFPNIQIIERFTIQIFEYSEFSKGIAK